MQPSPAVLLLLLISLSAWQCISGLQQHPKSSRQASITGLLRTITASATIFVAAPAAVLVTPRQALAVKGSVAEVGIEESKKAVLQIQKHISSLSKMDALADQGEYDEISELLATIDYGCFDTVVRSSAISPEDKIALGTIKRYGYIADAIIMVGGIKSALQAGGIKVSSSGESLQQSIEDDSEEDESSEAPALKVDRADLKKYIKLALGSFRDIEKIVAPVLNKVV